MLDKFTTTTGLLKPKPGHAQRYFLPYYNIPSFSKSKIAQKNNLLVFATHLLTLVCFLTSHLIN